MITLHSWALSSLRLQSGQRRLSTPFSRPVFTALPQQRAVSHIWTGAISIQQISSRSTRLFTSWRRSFAPLRTFMSLPASKMDPLVNARSAPLSECLADHLERPDLDNRTYRVIRLPNKLEALLIHDPDSDKASAALDVNAGSFSDAADMPGMAHAVEHLLFMGTEKYPIENAYNKYLSANSGYSNAYTAATSTNYFFEVAARSDSERNTSERSRISKETSPLYGALDRFAQFFINPLFLEDTLDRELKAVDSENKKNLQSDLWRLNQLNKSLSNPVHPYNHFSTGNLQTLRDGPLQRGVEIREEFMKFYEIHYSANRMKLVVLGQEPLDQLQEWVEELFVHVRNKDLPQNRWDDIAPLTEKELLTQVTAKPVMETRSLDIYFPYQDEENMYDSQPSRYLSHLLGHEGPGSILAYIKAKGWANALSAGSTPLCPGSALFTISIRLTPEGLKNYKDVTKTIFQYIALMKEVPPQKWIADEVAVMAAVDFRFKQKSPASKTTSRLSSVMQRPYPREWLLSGQELIRKFDPKAISNGLECLRPDNFRINVVTPDLPQNGIQRERWYGTQYTYEKLQENFVEDMKKAARSMPDERPIELHLPHRNEFIPSQLEVEKKEVAEPMNTPKLIRNDDNVRIWFKKDDQYWVPKANFMITLRTPLVSATPQTGAMSQIYKELVEDALAEYSYDAEIAGLEYGVITHSVGLDINISGYNDKMTVLLEKVLTTMRDLEVKDDRFEIIMERVARSYRNYEFTEPFRQIGQYSRWLNSEKGWILEQYLTELPQIKAADIRAFYPHLLRQTHIEVLAHGNFYREEALKATDLVEKILKPKKLPASQWPIRRNLLLPEGSNYVYDRPLKDSSNVNHCIEYYCSVGEIQDRERYAQLLLLAQLGEERAFNQLRTKEQLGYVVFSGAVNQGTVAGYRVLIQSEKTPEYLETRIDNFLRTLRSELLSMSEEDFKGHKRSLINKRLEKLKNLDQESGRFWSHINSEYYRFEQHFDDVKNIKPVTKDDMIKFFDRYIDPSSTTRAKISVHLLAQAVSESSESTSAEVLPRVKQCLTSHGIESNMTKLASRFKDAKLSDGSETGLVSALTSYLKNDVKIADDKIASIVEQATSTLGAKEPSLGNKEPSTPELPERIEQEATKIEDVHRFKASIPLGPGPTPVRDLADFEDLEPKL